MRQPVPPPISERMRALAERRAELERQRREREEDLIRLKAEEDATDELLDTIRWTVQQLYPETEPCSGDGATLAPRRGLAEKLTPRIIATMRERGSPLTAAQIAEILGGGVDTRSVGPVLGKLHKDGVLRPGPQRGTWEINPSAPEERPPPPSRR